MIYQGKIAFTGFTNGGDTERCWYPDSDVVENDKDIKLGASKDCCSVAHFEYKSDGTLWVTSATDSTEKCISVESMPITQRWDIGGKKLQLKESEYRYLAIMKCAVHYNSSITLFACLLNVYVF